MTVKHLEIEDKNMDGDVRDAACTGKDMIKFNSDDAVIL